MAINGANILLSSLGQLPRRIGLLPGGQASRYQAMKRLDPTIENLALMLDVFCGAIETGVMPAKDSPCHHMARWLVDDSRIKTKRKRTRLTHRKPKTKN